MSRLIVAWWVYMDINVEDLLLVCNIRKTCFFTNFPNRRCKKISITFFDMPADLDPFAEFLMIKKKRARPPAIKHPRGCAYMAIVKVFAAPRDSRRCFEEVYDFLLRVAIMIVGDLKRFN